MIYLEQARGRSQREGHHAKGTVRRGTGNPAGQGRPKVGADGQPATTQAETDRSKCESGPGAQGQQQQSNGSRRKTGRNGNPPTPKATGWAAHPTTTDRNRYEGRTLPDGGRGEAATREPLPGPCGASHPATMDSRQRGPVVKGGTKWRAQRPLINGAGVIAFFGGGLDRTA